MKVVHINFSDSGGAANALLRLHEGLLRLGVDSHILVLFKEKTEVKNNWQYLQNTKS